MAQGHREDVVQPNVNVPFVCPFCGRLHWLTTQLVIVFLSRRCQQRYDRLSPAAQQELLRNTGSTN